MTKITVDTVGKRVITLTNSDEYYIEILCSGAELEVLGLFHAQKKEKINIRLTVVHLAPHTKARTKLKGVAQDESMITFFGRIKVESGCFDTQSFLEERVLLLSDQARAEVIPELEILCDDVKCSHAASISQIPDEQIFYLESRGIPKSESEGLIIDGFLHS